MTSEISLTTYRKLKVIYSSMVARVKEISEFRQNFIERNAKRENGILVKDLNGDFVFENEEENLEEFNNFLDSLATVFYEVVDEKEIISAKLKPKDWERVTFYIQ